MVIETIDPYIDRRVGKWQSTRVHLIKLSYSAASIYFSIITSATGRDKERVRRRTAAETNLLNHMMRLFPTAMVLREHDAGFSECISGLLSCVWSPPKKWCWMRNNNSLRPSVLPAKNQALGFFLCCDVQVFLTLLLLRDWFPTSDFHTRKYIHSLSNSVNNGVVEGECGP